MRDVAGTGAHLAHIEVLAERNPAALRGGGNKGEVDRDGVHGMRKSTDRAMCSYEHLRIQCSEAEHGDVPARNAVPSPSAQGHA